jgi:lipid-binding SYLF domain-containing protein
MDCPLARDMSWNGTCRLGEHSLQGPAWLVGITTEGGPVDHRSSARAALLLLTFVLTGSSAHAQNAAGTSNNGTPPSTVQGATRGATDAQVRVKDAAAVLRRMKSDPQVNDLLQDAKGLLIVPHFIKAALVFGGRGGSGLLVVQKNGRWSDPAFYRTSGGSFGAQIGGAKGSLVMILTSDRAVAAFANKTSTWSLNAGAGLTAANYSNDTRESGTLSDVVIWSDTKGLFCGAAVGATKVGIDQEANRAYYNQPGVTPQEILSGLVANESSNVLREVLPMQRASK